MPDLIAGNSSAWGWPLALSALAGISTGIGGLIAICAKPSSDLMALSLGGAIGVMSCVSIVELIVKNAMENDPFLVLAAALLGGLVYYVLEPYFPHMEEPHAEKSAESADSEGDGEGDTRAGGGLSRKKSGGSSKHKGPSLAELRPVWMEPHHHHGQDAEHGRVSGKGHAERTPAQKSASLMRLGLLMALTMTLHNLPEGFAVAFAAFTKIGVVMAIAIAVHNIPEGVIIAAPIYAATGSKLKAVGLATASGLSEPLGALLALVVLHPFITEERLHYMLACVGGLMLAVCFIELWPEGRNCKNDKRMGLGIVLGVLIMGWTLWVEGEE